MFKVGARTIIALAHGADETGSMRHSFVLTRRRAQRLAWTVAGLVCTGLAIGPVAGASTAARLRGAVRLQGVRVIRPQARLARDPVSNRTLSGATLWTCEANPAGAGCVTSVVSAIDRARAGEGVRPIRLPSGFPGLSVPQQLLAIADLERSDRGLTPAIGLSRSLDQSAAAGARAQQDPAPSPFYGNAYGSNWAGGIGSSLAVDFFWMYDDGRGSSNIDCRSPQSAGCWGHRHNVLYPYQAPLAMGAALVGTSMTELFVGGDTRTHPGQADAPLVARAAHH
jgi:hypothetical protein